MLRRSSDKYSKFSATYTIGDRMSLEELGMDFTGSFLKGDGVLEYIEHSSNGTQSYQLENVFPFTSIADIKRMIWLSVEGKVDYMPKYLFLAVEKDGGFYPLEFHWPTESKITASLPDPLTNKQVNPELVDSAGNRSGLAQTTHLYAALEDVLLPLKLDLPVLHVWRMSEVVGERATLDARLFDGFVRLYFPWLSSIEEVDEAYKEEGSESETTNTLWESVKTYVTARQEQLERIEAELHENSATMGELSCRAIEKIKILTPPITPKPESLEILFYELTLSPSMPFIRYFSDRGDQEPILRYLKNVYLPQEAVAQWLKEPMTKKEKIIKGKVLIRGNGIPVGSAFDISFGDDNKAHLVELESPRKDHLFLGSLVEEGLKGLKDFVAKNNFEKKEPQLELTELQGKFLWEHPDPSSSRPSIEELKNRIRNYSYIFDLEKGEPGVINLRYTAVSNYESANNITGYLSRINATEFSSADLDKKESIQFFTNKIQSRFGKTEKEANAIVVQWIENKGKQETVVQGEGKDVVSVHHDGIIITLRNNHPSYEIEIANLLPPNAGETLRRIMAGIALILLEKKEISAETAKVVEATAAVRLENATAKQAEIEPQTRAASATAQPQSYNVDLDFLNLLPEGNEGEEDRNETGPEEQGAEAPLGSVTVEVAAEATPVVLASRAPSATPSLSVVEPAVSMDEVQKDVDQFYITKLKQLDLQLFGYQDKSTGKTKGYSTACQTSNGDMPHSLSQSQYARVKEIYKDKITFIEGPKPAGWKLNDEPPKGYGKKVTWTQDNNFTPPRPVWVTLLTGSETKRNWYFCAKYWCLKDDIPLIESEFEAAKECPICHGKQVQGRGVQPGETVVARRTHKGFKKFIGFQSKAKHPNNWPLPCCGIKPKEDKLVDKTRPYNKVSVEAVEDEEPPAEGQLEYEDDKAASQSRGVIPPVEISKILSSLQTKYIKSAGKYPLGPGELGIVPPQIDALFGQDSTQAIKKMGPQQMLSRETPVFVRFGLQNTEQPGNRFLSMLGFICQKTFNMDTMINLMKRKEFVHAFEDANYGTLVHEFARPDLPAQPVGDSFTHFCGTYGYSDNEGKNRANNVRLFYAYQNFMNYVRDAGTPKDIRYFDHILMMPKVLSDKGYLLIRILRDNDSDDWIIQCPAFGIPSTVDSPAPVFIIQDERYNVWEPLVLYNGSDKAVVSFDLDSLRDKLRRRGDISSAINEWIEQIVKRGVACGRKETPPYSWLPSAIEANEAPAVPTISQIIAKHPQPYGIVRERSNRFVGFLFKNNENRLFFIPARDDGASIHQFNRYYEKNALPKPTLSELSKFFTDNRFIDYPGLKIIKIVMGEEQSKYIAVLLSSGVLLPIEPTQDSAGLDVQSIKEFPWDLDEKLTPLPAETATNSVDLDTAEGFLNEVYQYLRLILANHFKRSKEGEDVLREANKIRESLQISLPERRNRLQTILSSVIHRFVKETPYTKMLEELPRIRKNIGSASRVEDCPPGIATYEDSVCKLKTPSESVLTARLVDEILRNHWAFSEIEDNRVSRIRPLSGTLETPTEIITTDTFRFDSTGKKSKYSQGLKFAEEQPDTIDLLKTVLGGGEDVDDSPLIEQMIKFETKALHQDIPRDLKEKYKLFLNPSTELEGNRLILGLQHLFSFIRKSEEFTEEKINFEVKRILTKLGAPADILASKWTSSAYDFFGLAAITRCRIVLLNTTATGAIEIKRYFNPSNSDHIVIFWGAENDLVVEKQNDNAYIRYDSLPLKLRVPLDRMETTTAIKKIGQLKDIPLEPIGLAPLLAPLVVPPQPTSVAEAEADSDLGPVEREPEPSAPSALPAEPVEDFAGVVQPENVKIELPDLEEGGGAVVEEAPVVDPVDEAPVLGPAEETSQIQEPPLSQPLPPADEPQISRPLLPASSPAEEPETSHYLDEESPELAPSPAPRNSPPESADTRSAESHNANNLYPEGDLPDQA
jgi:hypothetical protein